jgi:uncharacterized protein (DUF885 family)
VPLNRNDIAGRTTSKVNTTPRLVGACLAALLLGVAPAQTATGSADAALLRWVETRYQLELDAKPMLRASLGLPGDADRWDDLSDEQARADAATAARLISELNSTFSDTQLSEAGKLNKRLYLYRLRQRIDRQSCALNLYPMNHYDGAHFDPVTILLSRHSIASESDARHYIARLHRIPALLQQLQDAATARGAKGYHAPRFSLQRLAKESAEFGEQTRRTAADGNALLADFETKLGALPDAQRQTLAADAQRVLRDEVAPAYVGFAATARALSSRSPGDHGVSAQADGDRCYRVFLKHHTTIDVTPETLHELGLSELQRMKAELLSIARSQGHTGSVREFIQKMREAPSSYFPDDEAGRAAYLKEATLHVERAAAAMSQWFWDAPKAKLEVRRVEAFREGSVGTAFYEQPAADGSRPGVFYANLRSTKLLPRYQIEVLVHHEGIPGHHIQIGLVYENQNLPTFRRFDDYTAYTEGWGLYAEALPKQYGFYDEPLNDVGRLALSLRRAARLSVDTGIHALGWTREQAVQFMLANTADSEASIRDEVDRYFVTPGQATAYMVGVIELLKLREEMVRQLGTRFDIRDFHRAVLENGTLPLTFLRDEVGRATARLATKTRSR